MSTITFVIDKDKKPQYKDYVNFLGSYKNGKRDECDNNSVGYSLSSSASSSSTEISELPTKSFNEYLQSYTKKKFQPVQPDFIPTTTTKPKNVKTEMFIQINNNEDDVIDNSFEQIQKKFNNNVKITKRLNSHESNNNNNNNNGEQVKSFLHNNKRPINVVRLNSNNIKQNKKENTQEKPIIPKKITIINGIQPKKQEISSINKEESKTQSFVPPPPPPPPSVKTSPPSHSVNLIHSPPPPPLPPVNIGQYQSSTLPRVSNNQKDTVDALTINRNDPRFKKVAYGALRNMYGAYHDKANDYLATLPKNRIKKGNGLDSIINSIAAQGGLDKLCGRSKVEAD